MHRLVILPDYQGVGIGTKFLGIIAKHYTENGFRVLLNTSAKNLVIALSKRKDWKFKGVTISNGNTGPVRSMRNASRKSKIASLEYIGVEKTGSE